MKAVTVVSIRGRYHAWKVVNPSETGDNIQKVMLTLEIEGNEKDGYHLLMSPAGFFTADTWHETMEDAKETAHESFGIPLDGWSSV